MRLNIESFLSICKKMKIKSIFVSFFLLFYPVILSAGDIYIGAATANITPKLPVALDGQMHLRIARTIETPLEADILVLETRNGTKSLENVVFVSCDMVAVPAEMLGLVRDAVKKLTPGIKPENIIINATHTHTGPVIRKGLYPIPEGVTRIEDYYAYFTKQVSEAINKAWNNRTKGSISWGISQAKLGYNRRAVYADGSAVMYGKTNKTDFRSIEGFEDSNVNTLFCWGTDGKLLAMGLNVACTAQELEHRSAVNADYLHPARVMLRKQYGNNLPVISWIGAAGDQSPHLMMFSAAENRMMKLRNIERTDELARRLKMAIDDAYQVVVKDRHSDVILEHKFAKAGLPMRIVTDAEYENSKKEIESIRKQIEADPKTEEKLFRRIGWEGDVLKRYEAQKMTTQPLYEVHIHVVRLGDIVICTNPFELFIDFGIAMQARSRALQTFVVQLAGPGTYLPTGKAQKGGSYSAIIESNIVGPEGGQLLVDKTVELINGMWEE
jgi:hypothetical protein